MAASTPRLVKVSFSCLMCGLETPSIEIRIDELSRAAVRRALTMAELPGFRPLWDASLTPHCPRCRGRLLLELGSVSLWRQLEAAQA
jgi:ribosomal protein S14